MNGHFRIGDGIIHEPEAQRSRNSVFQRGNRILKRTKSQEESFRLLIDHGTAVRQLEPAPASPAKTKTHALFDRFDVKAHR